MKTPEPILVYSAETGGFNPAGLTTIREQYNGKSGVLHFTPTKEADMEYAIQNADTIRKDVAGMNPLYFAAFEPTENHWDAHERVETEQELTARTKKIRGEIDAMTERILKKSRRVFQ